MKFGQLQIADSVNLVVDANITRDRQWQKEGKPPRDEDSSWKAKGNKIVETVHNAESKTKYFHGYKNQISLNAESDLVTSIIPEQSDNYDVHEFQNL